MRIGQVVHLYRPHLGGIENYVYRLKGYLESKGHQVTIYTTDLLLEKGFVPEEETVYCKTTLSLLRNPLSLELVSALRDSDEDVYHLHSPWFLTSLVAARVLREKPKVMTVHSAEIRNVDIKSRILNQLYRPFAKRILSNMDGMAALSERERDLLLREFSLPPADVVTIPNGIQVDGFERNDEDGSLLHEDGSEV